MTVQTTLEHTLNTARYSIPIRFLAVLSDVKALSTKVVVGNLTRRMMALSI